MQYNIIIGLWGQAQAPAAQLPPPNPPPGFHQPAAAAASAAAGPHNLDGVDFDTHIDFPDFVLSPEEFMWEDSDDEWFDDPWTPPTFHSVI